MALHTQVDESSQDAELDINPVYVRERSHEIPRYRLPEHSMLPATALQVVRDELILDGNARLNLATFVTTWMEPEAEVLMAECAAKNMIDKDEYRPRDRSGPRNQGDRSMPLHTQVDESSQDAELDINPVYVRERSHEIPRYRLPEQSMLPGTAVQVVRDELILDGNARLNLATFVTTWMEPEADMLMAECAAKNMIDKDEYPQTAELEHRCVNILGNLWNSPAGGTAAGCSTTGSSEACMLGGMALLWRWRARRQAAGLDATKPNLVMGSNVQVCWEKFCRYWQVEPRYVPMVPGRLHLRGTEAAAKCDENTIGVVAILGSTMDGSYEPVLEISRALDRLQAERGHDVLVHVDAASGGFVAPFIQPDLEWDFRVPRVASINASGHKYGLVYPGVGWVMWRTPDALPRRPHLPGELPGRRDADVRAQLLPARRPGRRPVLQLHQARPRGLSTCAADLPGRRAPPVRRDREDRAVRAALGGPGPAGVRVQAARRRHQLLGVRPVGTATDARLAGSCLHVPGGHDRHRGDADRDQERLQYGPGQPAAQRSAPACAVPGASSADAAAAGDPAKAPVLQALTSVTRRPPP